MLLYSVAISSTPEPFGNLAIIRLSISAPALMFLTLVQDNKLNQLIVIG
jgi:hypothetical protein